jgi:hypothetical protein
MPHHHHPIPDKAFLDYFDRCCARQRKLAYLTAHYPYSGRHMYFAMAAHARRYGWADY